MFCYYVAIVVLIRGFLWITTLVWIMFVVAFVVVELCCCCVESFCCCFVSVVCLLVLKIKRSPLKGAFFYRWFCLCVSPFYFSSSSSAPACLVSSCLLHLVFLLVFLLDFLFSLPAFPLQKAIWCKARGGKVTSCLSAFLLISVVVFSLFWLV